MADDRSPTQPPTARQAAPRAHAPTPPQDAPRANAPTPPQDAPRAHAPTPRQDAPRERAPELDFGPRGYLPQRAAQRARKIILREQLGLGWVIASAVAGVVLLAVGTWFVVSQLGPPGPPFVEVAAAGELASGEARRVEAGGEAVLLVRAAGRLSAFRAPDAPVGYCPESGHLEGADGTVWGMDGRRLSADGDSLAELPVEVHSGGVYVDPTAEAARPVPHDRGARPRCGP